INRSAVIIRTQDCRRACYNDCRIVTLGSFMGDILNKIRSKATVRSFKKRSILLYQGEAPRMAYVLKSGVVKLYTINNAGEEQIAAFHAKYDIFPSSWIFGKSSTT